VLPVVLPVLVLGLVLPVLVLLNLRLLMRFRQVCQRSR
jgi:hypothetical protein